MVRKDDKSAVATAEASVKIVVIAAISNTPEENRTEADIYLGLEEHRDGISLYSIRTVRSFFGPSLLLVPLSEGCRVQ